MTYWVVRIDGDLPKQANGNYSEVRIQYPSDSYEEAKKTADILNEGEAKKAEAKIAKNTGTYHPVSKGTTIVSYIVMSDEDLQQYYRIGTRVVR